MGSETRGRAPGGHEKLARGRKKSYEKFSFKKGYMRTESILLR